MAGHRDTTVSITVGPEVGGMEIMETAVDALFGPNATPSHVVMGMRSNVKLLLYLLYVTQQGGDLAQAQQFIDANVRDTN